MKLSRDPLRGAIGVAIVLAAGACMDLAAGDLSDDKPTRTGTQIYQTFCGQCHNTGWLGAPIAGQEGDWSARRSAGVDTLLLHSKEGLNSMPPMGTCMDCTDEELRAAIAEMLKP